jgi:hypothetical protein
MQVVSNPIFSSFVNDIVLWPLYLYWLTRLLRFSCGNVASILQLDEYLSQEYKVFSSAPLVSKVSFLTRTASFLPLVSLTTHGSRVGEQGLSSPPTARGAKFHPVQQYRFHLIVSCFIIFHMSSTTHILTTSCPGRTGCPISASEAATCGLLFVKR